MKSNEKLWVFGCSHGSRDYNLDESQPSWPEIVAEQYHLELHNHCRSGYSNDEIFRSILRHRVDFRPEDMVIIQFTHPERVVHAGLTMQPSDSGCEQWYKTVNSDDFYDNKFIQTVAACRNILCGFDYYYGYVDPTLLIQQFSEPVIKSLVMPRAVLYPKLILHKGFDLGLDGRHLSATGNRQLASHWIQYLNNVRGRDAPA